MQSQPAGGLSAPWFPFLSRSRAPMWRSADGSVRHLDRARWRFDISVGRHEGARSAATSSPRRWGPRAVAEPWECCSRCDHGAVKALMPDFYVPNEARISVNNYALRSAAGVSVLTGSCSVPGPGVAVLAAPTGSKHSGRAKVSGTSAAREERGVFSWWQIRSLGGVAGGREPDLRGFLSCKIRARLSTRPGCVLVGFAIATQALRDIRAARRLHSECYSKCPRFQAYNRAIGNGGLPFGDHNRVPRLKGAAGGLPRIIAWLISADYSRRWEFDPRWKLS